MLANDHTCALFSQLIGFCYLPLAYVCLRFFDCKQTEPGVYVMSENPGIRCYDASYNALIPLILAFALLYCIGFPVAVLLLLMKKKRKMDPVKFALRCTLVIPTHPVCVAELDCVQVWISGWPLRGRLPLL